ncbi:MAG: transporter, family, nitrate/nitrite transporter [Patescibacteria group bacterium]|nr:MFS transporter [Candidatus Saccharibacteria bacterium]MDQ5963776.1 transporter, family, nitrate/nitrite transporter [Patescibacteria group bacterium]
MKQAKNNSNGRTALLLATTALVLNFWAWTLLSPLGTQYATKLSLQPLSLSLLLAVPVLVGALGRIVLGMLTDKYGGKTMLSLVCFLTAMPVMALAFVSTYMQLIGVATILGLGGAVFAVGVPFVSAWFAPKRKGLVLGIYSMGNAGTALSAFATPRLADALGLDRTFFLVAALLFAMGMVCMRYGQDSPIWKPQQGSAVLRMVAAAKQRITWDLAALYVVTFGAFVAFGVYLPVLLKVAYGLSFTDAASRAAGFVLLATVARPIGGWLSDSVGGKTVVRVSLVTVSVLATFVGLQPTLHSSTTAAYLSLACVLGVCNGAIFALLGRLAKPENMGSVAGIVGAAGGLGGFLPPLILGLTYQKTHSYAIALIMLAISAFLVLVYIHMRFKDVKVYNQV